MSDYQLASRLTLWAARRLSGMPNAIVTNSNAGKRYQEGIEVPCSGQRRPDVRFLLAGEGVASIGRIPPYIAALGYRSDTARLAACLDVADALVRIW